MTRRQRMVLLLRGTASAVMLAVLVTRVDVATLLPRRDRAAVLWILGALVVTLVGVVLSTLRWQFVLRVLEIPADLRSLLVHSLAGLFVGNFLPTTIGGDVLRVTRLSAVNGEPPATFASVVLERLTGWLVLPFITLFALFTHPALLHLGAATRAAVLLALGTLTLLAGVLVIVASPQLGARLRSRPGWLRFAAAVHLGLRRFRQQPLASASVLLVGCAYQLAVVLAAGMIAAGVGIHVGWAPIVAFVPAVAIAQVLPVSVGGLGVREAAFVLFLHPLGVPAAQAITLGLAFYAVNLAASLAGAPAFAVGSRQSLGAA